MPEKTTAAVDGSLVHLLRVYEPGEPGQLSQLGMVRAELGVTAPMLERSTAAAASGLDCIPVKAVGHGHSLNEGPSHAGCTRGDAL